MKQYIELLNEILDQGEQKGDRTGTGTISIFGTQKKYDLREGFPLVTSKKVSIQAIIYELLWFLKGSTNINDDLTQHTPIWNAWAAEDGDLGPIYGYQWIKWEKFVKNESTGEYEKFHINQIQEAIDTIKNNPNSRRIIVSAWNVADIDRMALPPCHAFMQFYVINGRLDLQMYQRSADTALGVPYNIASYSILLMMVAQECDLEAGIFTHSIGDTHLYNDHIDKVKEQVTRPIHKLPKLTIAKKPFWDLTIDDFELTEYEHEAFIKFPIAI